MFAFEQKLIYFAHSPQFIEMSYTDLFRGQICLTMLFVKRRFVLR
ncbi:hypothetical protein Y11_34431 [Yersinia enterocolitica subsp. palearctica Y11]|uniref:Uncharacterized protein n=1 Tax=Yersinia enterocolitica subsp. palearctica serotype O:3 (strain DSM 13030 / CIP 106945 / Y11) TaxID=930944 RepID=A0A0H3P0V7_YERE1|nr:hypothetical protein Y11_34431 [Yersinia enterocolitica subsp. palearctica Y11]CCO67821.1 hypothetical protein D322_941 [Yersinia enterocolitica IP 10393]